jgi:hypothetical protein
VVSDSIMNGEKEKITKNLEIKYETREKEAQIIALKLEKHLTNQRNGWIAAFLLSLVGAGAWFLRYRHRREKALLEKDLETQTPRKRSAARQRKPEPPNAGKRRP